MKRILMTYKLLTTVYLKKTKRQLQLKNILLLAKRDYVFM
jgi:hypothetical protein